VKLWTDHIRTFAAHRGLDFTHPDSLLYFSVHGTPVKYIHDGNRYDRYAFEHCAEIAAALDADRYAVGFQNHTNRRIVWTQPDNEVRIREAAERRLIVVPISFLREQSETLAELDHELRDFADGLGKEFHRVPVPHGDPALPVLMADLACEAASENPGAGRVLSRCRCRAGDGTWCTNGARELPASPYVPPA
jgi:ferrochelatase